MSFSIFVISEVMLVYPQSCPKPHTFRDILGHGENDQVVLERQGKCVIHAVDQYAADGIIIFLFSAISETGNKMRECTFREFISRNSDYAMFEKIQLDSNSCFGSTSEIVADLQGRIEFLESLLPYVNRIKYLQHAKRIRDRIDFWKDQIEREETEAITRKLYQ